MANVTQFIGSKISLISKSEIRYEGILYSLNVVEATISLAKVKSFGTEDRPTERPVPPKDEIYDFIIFRGSDIKGIDVLEPPKPTPTGSDGLPIDPAIVEVSHYNPPSRPQHPSNIGPVPVQVQASPAYAAGAGSASYGSSPFSGPVSPIVIAPPPKPAPVANTTTPKQPSRTGALSSTLVDNSTERFNEAVANEASGLNSSPQPFPASNQRQEEQPSKLISDRETTRGYSNQRGRDSGLRGVGGRGRAEWSNRGRFQNYSSSERQENQRQTGRAQGSNAADGNENQQRPRGRFQTSNVEGQDNERRSNPQGTNAVEGEDNQRHHSQGYNPRGRGGGNLNVSRGGTGYRGGRGGFRGNRTQGILPAPHSAKVIFDGDFDFEKANEELQIAIKNLKVAEKANEIAVAESNGSELTFHEAEEQENKEPQQPCYKKDDFFDSISCEASERGKGASSRPDWKAERKLNAETFGVTGQRRIGGYYRGSGGRGYFNHRGSGYGYGRGGGYGGGYRGSSRGGGGYYNSSGYNTRYGGSNTNRRGRGASNVEASREI